jgi:Fic family protein
MQWNWQQHDWKNFTYKTDALERFEYALLEASGMLLGACKHLEGKDQDQLRVELICDEALKTSEIEGEYLDRDSVQSSVRKHFGLETDGRKVRPAERGIAELMVNLYEHYALPLDHTMLFSWHRMVMNGRMDIEDIGSYRKGEEPMQVVSGTLHDPTIHFEAPPAHKVEQEMEDFILWFNRTERHGEEPLPVLVRAGITHLYFESIHPFEDGNGRIGRALAEKALAQGLKHPTVIALSTVIGKHKKDYYDALEKANKKNEITEWLEYFAEVVLGTMASTQAHITFLIEKTKFFEKLQGKLNPRQEKCLVRMFQEGVEGFKGGLSAENYIRITKAPRPTATRDLADLVAKGSLRKTGELRYTRYWLNINSS